MLVRELHSVFVCVCEREKERKRVCVRKVERVRVYVCVDRKSACETKRKIEYV